MFAKRISRMEGLAGLFILLLGVVLFRNLELKDSADDVYFLTALDDKTLLEFLRERYMGWSGRVLLEGITVITIRYAWLFKTGITLTFILMCYQVYRLSLRDTLAPLAGVLLVAGIVLMMPASVSQWGGWWVTGFYNYLLPTALGLFAFRILCEKHEHGKLYQALALVSAVVACQQEQVAIALLAAILTLAICRAVRRERIGAEGIVLAGGLVSAAVLFAAPGSHVRLAAETSWLLDFTHMNLLEKLALGLDRVNAHANDADNGTFLLALLTTVALLCAKREHWQLKGVAVVVLGVGIASLLWTAAGLSLTTKLTFSGQILPAHWRGVNVFIALAKTMMLYGTLAVCAVYFAERWQEWVALVGALALSFGMIMVLGFSPTVYASGARIFYLSDVLMATYICWVIAHIVARYRMCAATAARATGCA